MKNLKFGIIESESKTEDSESNTYSHFEGEMFVDFGNFFGFSDSFFAEVNRENNIPSALSESEFSEYEKAHISFFEGFEDKYFNIGYIPFLPKNMIWIGKNVNLPILWVENKNVFHLINTKPKDRIYTHQDLINLKK